MLAGGQLSGGEAFSWRRRARSSRPALADGLEVERAGHVVARVPVVVE